LDPTCCPDNKLDPIGDRDGPKPVEVGSNLLS
jgi:hypothetical protein